MTKPQIDLRADQAVTTELSDAQLSNVSGGKGKGAQHRDYLVVTMKDIIITSVSPAGH